MRGKEVRRQIGIFRGRITPAYAGKSSAAVFCGFLNGDHPRLCGEKADLFGVTTDYLGSPPPMRGKACEMFLEKSGDGITPAYAGKRRSPAWAILTTRDHPRLCGEK